ncbi:uncharacterized protein LOC119849226 isoform X1 [Dermochelys coriacea]|uniref:uncharacterized protein LOC119849226 isoform X1 n=1 Tax=Dermochelys coriacea TaxID=27794 RepID=UPI001CA85CBC|nr:uncharacterized protein LOC119849226 isoform X1 [Dermochelys coriacea]
MNSIIRPCTVKDCKVILQLIKEIAVHYRVPPTEVKVTLEALREDGFGAQPQFDCYVAELPPRQTNKEGGIVGYVLSSYTYSAWKGRNLYVDNLYVQPQFRGRQIGKRLIEKAAQEGATFHKALDQVKTTPKALREDGFGRHPKFGCLVAEVPPDHRSKDGHTVVGYQFHYFSYCTWQGRIVFGEDLYVMPEFRARAGPRLHPVPVRVGQLEPAGHGPVQEAGGRGRDGEGQLVRLAHRGAGHGGDGEAGDTVKSSSWGENPGVLAPGPPPALTLQLPLPSQSRGENPGVLQVQSCHHLDFGPESRSGCSSMRWRETAPLGGCPRA